MSTKHTPGFWFQDGLEVHAGIHICDVNENPKDREQHVANARLIAAAPDLYESVEMLLGVFERGTNTLDEFDAVLDQARRALLKARGES